MTKPTIIFTEVGGTYQTTGKLAKVVARICELPLDGQTVAVPCKGWRPLLARVVNAGYSVRLEQPR